MSRPMTYCNPLPIPNYQRGGASRNKESTGWMSDVKRDFREMADPTVIRFRDRWYLFPSCGVLWYSDDMVNWTYHPIEPADPGWAPHVVQKGDDLYMTACGDQMWHSQDPLGPWELLGTIKDENGRPTSWLDPMLFVDDGGSMYCYQGIGSDGIYVVKLKDDDPTSYDGPKVHCFAFNSEHVWERYGEFHEDPDKSYIEGAWMTKHNGRYYLQYSAPGTEWKGYSLGCYVSDNPMGPFRYQETSPILQEKRGLVNGCGHHSVVEGPDGHLWCFYTTLVRIEYKFERRIAMDPVGFDESGNMFVSGPTETPQFAPGVSTDPARENDAGLLPVSVNKFATASSYAPGREPCLAVDHYIRTWWEAADEACPQWISVDLDREFDVSAARTMFADRGLDYEEEIVPGPYHYRIEGSVDGKMWEVLLDQSDNSLERHIAYDKWAPRRVRHVRLTVLSAPPGMRAAVWEFTVFGRAFTLLSNPA